MTSTFSWKPCKLIQFSRRYWIGKLLQVLNATDFRLGSHSNLDDQTIADARKPFNVVIDWVHQLAVSLEHDCVAVSFEHDYPLQRSFLTHAMVTASANIAFTFDRKETSVYLHRLKVHSLRWLSRAIFSTPTWWKLSPNVSVSRCS